MPLKICAVLFRSVSTTDVGDWEGRSMTTFYYCSLNHQSGLQRDTFFGPGLAVNTYNKNTLMDLSSSVSSCKIYGSPVWQVSSKILNWICRKTQLLDSQNVSWMTTVAFEHTKNYHLKLMENYYKSKWNCLHFKVKWSKKKVDLPNYENFL